MSLTFTTDRQEALRHLTKASAVAHCLNLEKLHPGYIFREVPIDPSDYLTYWGVIGFGGDMEEFQFIAPTITLTGYSAIGYAEIHGLLLSKYEDPTEGARGGLSVAEAKDIAREDPTLIYLTAPAGTRVFWVSDGEYATPVEAASAREAVEVYLDTFDFGDRPTVSGNVYLRPTDYSDPSNHLAGFTGTESGVTEYQGT